MACAAAAGPTHPSWVQSSSWNALPTYVPPFHHPLPHFYLHGIGSGAGRPSSVVVLLSNHKHTLQQVHDIPGSASLDCFVSCQSSAELCHTSSETELLLVKIWTLCIISKEQQIGEGKSSVNSLHWFPHRLISDFSGDCR